MLITENKTNPVGGRLIAAALFVTLMASTNIATATQTFDVIVTSDNAYAIYIGDLAGDPNTLTLEGWAVNTTASQIWSTESYPSVSVPDAYYIYIAVWSDDQVIQGFLADFDNITSGGKVLSGEPQWEVTATGIDLDNNDLAPTLVDLGAQIALANLGTNPSGGWVANTPSPLSNGDGGIHNPLITIGNIDDDAHWMWYDSGMDGSATAPFDGFNHDEYLIFRIPVTAPEPASLGLLAIGGLALLRRRRKQG